MTNASISASVGENGTNVAADVITVQRLLNGVSQTDGGPSPLLDVDGTCGPKTKKAIQAFQLHQFGWRLADCRVDPDGPTLHRLHECSTAGREGLPGGPPMGESGIDLGELPVDVPTEPQAGDAIDGDIVPVGLTIGAVPPPPALNTWRDVLGHRLADDPADVRYYHALRTFAQELDREGSGPVNLDRYAVVIERFPLIDGKQSDIDSFTRHVRLNLNAFTPATIGGRRLATFAPYDPWVDEPLWTSPLEQGRLARLSITMGDNGTVAVVMANGAQWMFKTVTTDRDGGHPVSGNRIFGVLQPEPGHTSELWFGTQGADQVTGAAMAAPAGLSGTVPLHFLFGRRLWRSFQNQLYAFVTQNGGAARKLPRYEKAYDWEQVERLYLPRPVTA